MRLYRDGMDGTFVRSPTDSTVYIPLSGYLEINVAPIDRAVERARIERIISQEESK